MMTKLYALRLADSGIGVYEVRPGIIRTDMTKVSEGRLDQLIQDGISPIRRWGEAEARTTGGRVARGTPPSAEVDSGKDLDSDAIIVTGPTVNDRCRSHSLLEAECDPTLGEIIGRHLDIDAIACQHADAVLAHLAGGMGQNLVLIIELHSKHRIGQ